MAFHLKGLRGATLPSHNITTTDTGSKGEATHNLPNLQLFAPSRAVTYDVNSQAWVRFTHIPSEMIRTEVANFDDDYPELIGRTFWESFSFITRQGTMSNGSTTVLGQMHQSPNICPPHHLSIERKSSGLYNFVVYIRTQESCSGAVTVPMWTGRSSIGHGIRRDVLIKVVLFRDTRGSLDIYWRESADTNNYTGTWNHADEVTGIATVRGSGSVPYTKLGIYRPSGDSSTWVVDWKGLYLADTRAEAETLYGTTGPAPDPTPDPGDAFPTGVTRFGADGPGNAMNNAGAGGRRGSYFHFPATSGNLLKVGVDSDGGGGGSTNAPWKVVVARRSDGIVVGSTAEGTIAPGADRTNRELAPASPIPLTGPQDYSIEIKTGGTETTMRYGVDQVAGALRFGSEAFGTTASPWTATGTDDKQIALYAVYEDTSPAPTPEPDPRVDALSRRVDALARRVDNLEARMDGKEGMI